MRNLKQVGRASRDDETLASAEIGLVKYVALILQKATEAGEARQDVGLCLGMFMYSF